MKEKFLELCDFLKDTRAVVCNGTICIFNQHYSDENEITLDDADGDDYFQSIVLEKIESIEPQKELFKVVYKNGDCFFVSGLVIKQIKEEN